MFELQNVKTYSEYMNYVYLLTVALPIFLTICLVLFKLRYPVRKESALEILKKRYASGEIMEEEYLKIKQEIK